MKGFKVKSKKYIPTDYDLLEKIYELYYEEFKSFSEKNKKRETKNYVPLDCRFIAEQLGVDDANIIFGRLYYHLEEKYAYIKHDGSKVEFFSFKTGDDKHCIQFPLMCSILAGLREEKTRDDFTRRMALWALIFSFISLITASLK